MPEIGRSTQMIALPTPERIFTPAVTVMTILIIVGFALARYAQGFVMNYLALNPQNVLRGMVWQLVSYSFINSCAWNMIFNGVVLLFIGSAIEREWKTKSFVLLWLVVTVACGVIWMMVNLFLRATRGQMFLGMGTDAFVFGIIGTFGLLFRNKRYWVYFATVKAQHLALIFIGMGLVLGIAQPIIWIWVLGALVAYVYVKLRWRLASEHAAGSAYVARREQGGFVDID